MSAKRDQPGVVTWQIPGFFLHDQVKKITPYKDR